MKQVAQQEAEKARYVVERVGSHTHTHLCFCALMLLVCHCSMHEVYMNVKHLNLKQHSDGDRLVRTIVHYKNYI